MRRILAAVALASLSLTGCEQPETVEWSDAPGIEVCEEVVDECAELCEGATADGLDSCGAELFDVCRDHVTERSAIVDRVPGLFVQLSTDVVMGRKRDCETAFGFLAAWRYE